MYTKAKMMKCDDAISLTIKIHGTPEVKRHVLVIVGGGVES